MGQIVRRLLAAARKRKARILDQREQASDEGRPGCGPGVVLMLAVLAALAWRAPR